MSIATTVGDALAFEEIDFQILRYTPVSSAADRVNELGIAAERMAKALLLKDPHGFLLTVIPATHELDLKVLRVALHRELTIADDEDLDELFCDCDVGSVPPIGPWYRVPTVVEASLKAQPDIYFEAGDHQSLVHVTETGFERLLDGAEYFTFSHQARA